MSLYTHPYAAANRFLDQIITGQRDAFKQSLSEDIVSHHCRLEGVIQTDLEKTVGIDRVFHVYEKILFDHTTNFNVKEWSVKCHNLTAVCTYAVEEDKNVPDGLQGRYLMAGHMKLSFVRDPSTQELLVKEVWEATAATLLSKLKTPQ